MSFTILNLLYQATGPSPLDAAYCTVRCLDFSPQASHRDTAAKLSLKAVRGIDSIYQAFSYLKYGLKGSGTISTRMSTSSSRGMSAPERTQSLVS